MSLKLLSRIKQIFVNRCIAIKRLCSSFTFLRVFLPLEIKWYLHRFCSFFGLATAPFVCSIDTSNFEGFKIRKKLNLTMLPGSLGILEDMILTPEYNVPLSTKKPIIIDCGANVGIFSILAWCYHGIESKVFSFEPVTENYRILALNVRDNRANCVPIKKGVYDQKKDADIFLHGNATHTFNEKSSRTERIHLTTIDHVVKEMKLKRIDILKLDIEGAELKALKGAKKSLGITKFVVVEANGKELKEISDFLLKNGFQLYASPKEFMHQYIRVTLLR